MANDIKLDGYSLSEKMRKTRRRYPLSSTEQALYHELVAICNEDGWEDMFPCSNDELCGALRITENTLDKARLILIQAGLIAYKSGKSKRQFGQYSFFQLTTTSKNEVKADTNVATNIGVNVATNKGTNIGVNVATNVEDYNKTKSKTKLNKKSISHSGEPPPKKEIDVTEFWNELVELWFAFNEQKFHERPSFKDADPKHLKKIVLALKKRAEEKSVEWTKDSSTFRLKSFLDDSFTDQWLKSNFLLSNLDKQMDKIILKQPKQQFNGNTKNATNGTASLAGVDYSAKLR